MGKGSGSNGSRSEPERDRRSRSERKAGRQRAERARAHGLPEPRPPQAVASARPERDAPLEAADVAPVAAARSGRPVLVWVLGGALVLLLIAYVVARFRDGGSP